MDKDVQFLFMISYWCALRMIEAVRLEKDDFILEDKELFIGMSKNKKNQRQKTFMCRKRFTIL